jgi:hypothetical protein
MAQLVATDYYFFASIPWTHNRRRDLPHQIAVDESDAGGLEIQLRPSERASVASQSKERCLQMLTGFTQTLLQLPVGSKEGVLAWAHAVKFMMPILF